MLEPPIEITEDTADEEIIEAFIRLGISSEAAAACLGGLRLRQSGEWPPEIRVQ